MPYRKQLLRFVAVALLLFPLAAREARGEEFSGAAFPCAQHTAKEAPDSSTDLALLWVHGYLAGLYKATGNLVLSKEAEDADLLRKALRVQCEEHPEASILTISLQVIAPAKIKIPAEAPSGLPVDQYSCGEHLDAKSDRRKLAEWWSFAFIQGYKNAKQPDMVIEPKNKPVLAGAIDKNCGNNRDATYMELTAMVAEAVKLE